MYEDKFLYLGNRIIQPLIYFIQMSLDQRLAMFASGSVVEIEKLQRGKYYMILHIYTTEYGQLILKLHKHRGTNIYVCLPRHYNNHYPMRLISEINSGSIFFKIRYVGSYLKYAFLEFIAIE